MAQAQAAACSVTGLLWDSLGVAPLAQAQRQVGARRLRAPRLRLELDHLLRELVRLQELAPLAQARRQVGTLRVRAPRLRLELDHLITAGAGATGTVSTGAGSAASGDASAEDPATAA